MLFFCSIFTSIRLIVLGCVAFYASFGEYDSSIPNPFPKPLVIENRTAIVLSGQFRGANISFLSGKVKTINYNNKNTRIHDYFNRFTPSNTIQTILEYLIAPQALHGGVDLFIYIPVPVNAVYNSSWDGDPLTYQPYPNDTRPCQLFKDSPIFASNTGNKVICLIEFETVLSNKFIADNPMWRNYFFYSTGREAFLQQEYGKYRGNLAVKQYSTAYNVLYKFKMRVRFDVAMITKMPQIYQSKLSSSRCQSIVYGPHMGIFGYSWQDSLNYGWASAMDTVLDRYEFLIAGNYIPSPISDVDRNWNSEAHLEVLMNKKNVCLDTCKKTRAIKIRRIDYHSGYREVVAKEGDWKIL